MLKRKHLESFLNYGVSLSRAALSLLSGRPRLKLRADGTSGRTVIIGNGPSLNQDWARILETEYENKVVVNFFLRSNKYAELKPNFYALADPWFWEIKDTDDDRKAMADFRERLARVTDWPITFVLPWRAKESNLVEFLRGQPNFKVQFYNDAAGFYTNRWPIPLLFRANLLCFRVETVLNLALYSALQMRPSEVHIFGADQSWHEDTFVAEDNSVMMADTHFYSATAAPARKLYEDTACTIPLKMSSMFFSLHKAFNEFDRLSEYAKWLQIPVYNLSSKTNLDMFDRQISPCDSNSMRLD